MIKIRPGGNVKKQNSNASNYRLRNAVFNRIPFDCYRGLQILEVCLPNK